MKRFDVIVMSLLAASFVPAWVNMSAVWSSLDYYAHGYLIVPLCLMVAWAKRPQLARNTPQRDARGGFLLAAALLLYGVGLLGDIISLQGLAFVAATAATVWLLFGLPWLRTLIFPIGYMAFMIPLPPTWIAPVIAQLRVFVSEAGVFVLQAMNMPVTHEGNVIMVPGGELFVAEACSGITSVITLAPIAVLLAYYTQRTWLGKSLLVASVVPLAMLGNLSRVLITVIAALEVGTERATAGPLHESAGLLTYVFGCLALLGVDALVKKIRVRPAIA